MTETQRTYIEHKSSIAKLFKRLNTELEKMEKVYQENPITMNENSLKYARTEMVHLVKNLERVNS